jgi:3-hydroxybutyrate dehydrogenase
MQKRVALITGGTSGIGLEMARQFAGSGYRLVLNGLEKDGESLCESLAREYGVPVLFS